MKFKVKKNTHIKSKNDKPVSVIAMSYCPSNSNELIEVVSPGELDRGYLWRRSEDNGQTWQDSQPRGLPEDKKIAASDKVAGYAPTGIFVDESRSLLMAAYIYQENDPSVPTYMDNFAISSRKLVYQLSTDKGESWGELSPVIDREYSQGEWPDGIGCYGGCADFNQACTLDDGTLVFPAWKFRYFPETDSIVEKDTRQWWLAVGALRGRWRNDNRGLNWEFSSWITLDRDKSSRGLCEPSIVQLNDGRLLMLIRAGKPAGNRFPGVKFYSISEDGGMNWSEPKILTYEDGNPMYSPSSMVQVFRWKAAGGIYLITNILDREDIIRGCDPRYPIQIAKINEETLCVEKDSITIIEDRKPEQAHNIRFSNFVFFEDKITGAIRMYMTACPGDVGKKTGDNIPLDSFEYIISKNV